MCCVRTKIQRSIATTKTGENQPEKKKEEGAKRERAVSHLNVPRERRGRHTYTTARDNHICTCFCSRLHRRRFDAPINFYVLFRVFASHSDDFRPLGLRRGERGWRYQSHAGSAVSAQVRSVVCLFVSLVVSQLNAVKITRFVRHMCVRKTHVCFNDTC